MAEDKVPMTVRGKKMLDDELKHLMTVERPTIVKAIEVARGHGDLSENADYSAAKERQGFIEGRIQEINAKLARAQVIDPSAIKSEKIVFGATVVVLETDSEKKITYQIVGVDEADIKSGKVPQSTDEDFYGKAKTAPMRPRRPGEKAKGGANWIQGAIKHPGALHEQLGVPAGKKIPAKKLAKAAKAPGKLGQRARLAETLKGMRKK